MAVCKLCFSEVNVAKGNAGLQTHLKHHHVDVYNRTKFPDLFPPDGRAGSGSEATSTTAKKSEGIDNLLGAVKIPGKTKRVENVLAATTAWVIEENMPLNAVEKPAFRIMLKAIDHFCPTATTKGVRDDISYLGLVSREAIKRELNGKYFSLTTDHWTSPNDETYSCLTAHWIENGKMHRAVLTLKFFMVLPLGLHSERIL